MTSADIVFCLDRGMLRPLQAAINSIVAHTATPERLRLNILVPRGEEEALFAAAMQAAYAGAAFTWRLAGIQPSPLLWSYVSGRFALDPAQPNYAGRHMAYARLQIADAFADLGTVLYLDPDLIVLDDVVSLIDATPLTPSRCFAAAPHPYLGLFYFRNPVIALGRAMSIRQPFNSGVFLTDLRGWTGRVEAGLAEIMEWDRQHGYRMFHLNDEPILNLLFNDHLRLPSRWNLCGLGNHPLVASLAARRMPKPAILHWSGGHRKPWKDRNIIFGDVWRRYAPPE